jgi:hypothetical protein
MQNATSVAATPYSSFRPAGVRSGQRWEAAREVPPPFVLRGDLSLSGQLPWMHHIEVRYGQRLTIGRAEARRADLLLPRPEVSEMHAAIEHGADGWFLEDLGSLNGTFVNGVAVTQRMRLLPGDVIRIGSVCFQLRAH